MDLPKVCANDDCCDHRRVIIHIDMDCYYAQVEMLKNPDLRTKPLGVRQKNCVVTCNYIAREQGIEKLMSVKNAQKCCPELVLVTGEDLTEYRDLSYKVSKFLQGISPLVERLGLDENFIDVTDEVGKRLQEEGPHHTPTGFIFNNSTLSESTTDDLVDECSGNCHQRLSVGSCVAQQMRDSIREEFGLTCCAGVAHNKLLAKLVSGTHKPNQQTLLFPEQVSSLLHSLSSVQKIPGIGPSTATKLATMSIQSISQMQQCSLKILDNSFGKETSILLRNYCLGIDDSPVIAFGKPQSHGLEDALKNCSSVEECQEKLTGMTSRLIERVTQDGRIPQTVRLIVRKASGGRESRQSPLPRDLWKEGTAEWLPKSKEKIVDLLMNLFKKLVDTKAFTLTLIGVTFCKFQVPEKCLINNYFRRSRSTEPEESGKSDIKRVCLEEPMLPPHVDLAVFKELPEDVKKEVLSEWHKSSGYVNPCASTVENIPHNVDSEVFMQLPKDIQKELRMKWEEGKDKKKTKNSPSITNYFKKA